MEQARLRVGDTLDDYCPRERRLTTHAVVALVEDRIKQTRCMTCDFEHAYKDGKLPAKRKKSETVSALAPPVSDAVPSPQIVVAAAKRPSQPEAAVSDVRGPLVSEPPRAQVALSVHEDRLGSSSAGLSPTRAVDHGELHEAAVHRRLIRATLPRLEGQAPTPRPIPEFTIRHAASGPTHGRRAADGNRAGGGKGRPRGDRGHFGAPHHAPGGSFRGPSHRFGKKGSR